MGPLAVAALGFRPEGGASSLPPVLASTGWNLVVSPEPSPPDAWLKRQQVDLFVLDRGLDDLVELTLRIGRLTGKPVVWIDRPGLGVPEGIWEQVVRKEWPLFGVLSPDAPRWAVVAVCRSLAAAGREMETAARKVRDLERKLDERKVVERAKGILMDRFDLAESEAYRRLRETAMRQRKSLREIAGTIIAFEDFEDLQGRR